MEERLIAIEERNKKVEADKKWETSVVRKVSIAILTYLFVVIFLISINESHVLLKALVPVLGFILSTLSLRFIRQIFKY